jgi:hypothetical protein
VVSADIEVGATPANQFQSDDNRLTGCAAWWEKPHRSF